MKILSLFDGMSCGYEALIRAGIPVDKYYASEIDKYAIQIALKNHPDIEEIGDVTKVKGEDYKDIDLLIGGSPCQGFSMAGKQLNFEDPRSKLFFEYVRILKEMKPKYFLLENVKMKKEYQDIISKELGVEPVEINSALLSAQNRKRLYRVGKLVGDKYEQVVIPQPKDKGILLKDILEDEVDEKYNLTEKEMQQLLRNFGAKGKILQSNDIKSNTLRASNPNGVIQGCAIRNQVTKDGMETQLNIRKDEKSNCVVSSYTDKLNQCTDGIMVKKLTPVECERLQTMPDNYTEGVSNTQRYKMLGNGWTCDVIAYIFSFLK